MAFSNFKFEVTAAVQNKINALALHVMENWDDFINNGECIISPETIELIHGNSYYGFIPFQDGGFQVGGISKTYNQRLSDRLSWETMGAFSFACCCESESLLFDFVFMM